MAENVDQDVREARRWMGKLPRDQFDLLLLLMREREAAGRQQGLREAAEVAQKRADIALTLAPNAVSAILDALPDAITALIEGEGC